MVVQSLYTIGPVHLLSLLDQSIDRRREDPEEHPLYTIDHKTSDRRPKIALTAILHSITAYEMESTSIDAPQSANKEPLLPADTRIFVMSQIDILIKTARNLRLEGDKAPRASGELKDRAAEVLCIVSSLLAMLAQSQREVAEGLRREMLEMGIGAEEPLSESVSPLDIGEPWNMNEE